MTRTSIVSPFGLGLAAILYVCFNTLLDVSPPLRIDLTADKLFTLSAGTHATLAEIDEPIELRFFFSERLGREVPFYAAYARRVRELLVEIAAASKGKVILHAHNPQPFSDEEDRAVSLGLQGIPIDQGGELTYFGLAGVNRVDEVELIPFFQPQRETLLEYDLAQIIHALSNPEPVVLGVISSLPILGDMQVRMQGGVSTPWAMAEHLRSSFEIINLPEVFDDLPERIDVAMVVHPQRLSERAVYELEQFLFRGGRAVLFIDPKSESARTAGPNDVSSSTGGLRSLFERWGIEVPGGLLTGDRTLALRINAGTAQAPVPTRYVVWLGATPQNMAQDDPVTGQLPVVNLASAGFIVREADSPLSLQPLIYSTENSAPVSVDDVRGIRPDILGLLEKFQPDDEVYVLAARLSGEVPTAFADGPPQRLVGKTDEERAQSPDRAQMMASDGPINVILVADSDLLEDRLWISRQQFFGREVVEPIAGNASFVLNAISNLAGSDELIRLRSRGVSQRPFDRVIDLQRTAERRLHSTERALQEKLKETQARIAELRGVRTRTDATTGEIEVEVSMTGEQRAEIEVLRQDMLSIRKRLRSVRRELREDVESLETWLQLLNIGLIPLLVAGIAVILGAIRGLRRRRSHGLAERTVAG